MQQCCCVGDPGTVKGVGRKADVWYNDTVRASERCQQTIHRLLCFLYEFYSRLSRLSSFLRRSFQLFNEHLYSGK